MTERTESQIAHITAAGAGDVGPESARSHNLAAVRSVADTVRTTLGPRGRDKMIEQPDGTVIITDDASTILEEVGVEEPAAALVVDVAEAVRTEYGDGATTAVVLAAALLREAETLVERGVHPNAVVGGYDRAAELSQRELSDLGAAVGGEAGLRHVVETAMAGKGLGPDRATLVDLVMSTAELVGEDGSIDRDDVRIVTQTGRPVADSELVDGAVLNDDPVRESMPGDVDRGRVLLTSDPVQLTDSSLDMNVEMDDAGDLSRFLDQEDEQIRNLVGGLVDAGADAVLCSSSIADEAQSALAAEGVLGVRRIDDDALAAAAAVLGGTVVSNVRDATTDALGEGSLTRDDDDELFVVRGDGETRATVLLRAPTEQLAEELRRHVETGLDVLATAAGGDVVAGGGAAEIELARRVRDAAAETAGREQLAVGAFADAIEEVPRVLAANAGLDPVDALVDLRRDHADGDERIGVAEDGTLIDTFDAGVREPVDLKRQAVASAVEAAGLVLRIDGILTVGELSDAATGAD